MGPLLTSLLRSCLQAGEAASSVAETHISALENRKGYGGELLMLISRTKQSPQYPQSVSAQYQYAAQYQPEESAFSRG